MHLFSDDALRCQLDMNVSRWQMLTVDRFSMIGVVVNLLPVAEIVLVGGFFVAFANGAM